MTHANAECSLHLSCSVFPDIKPGANRGRTGVNGLPRRVYQQIVDLLIVDFNVLHLQGMERPIAASVLTIKCMFYQPTPQQQFEAPRVLAVCVRQPMPIFYMPCMA